VDIGDERSMDKMKLLHGDCLELMKDIPNKSVDMILCDLPYGTTACEWDEIIPFEPLWEQYNRIIKKHGAIVLTATQPFASALVMSNPKGFKYEWVWDKVRPSGFQIVKYKPMQRHENVLVFTSKGECVNYFPIMERRDKPVKGRVASSSESSPLKYSDGKTRIYTHKNPQSIIVFPKPNRTIHPTQKPVALLEYLIKTYTNEGETVLDNCMGSGSTGVACVNTNRNFIGIELDDKYFKIAKERIESHKTQRPARPLW
jgi:site-specific DNA-methyltransferase (adenine-specific)